jgi:hypothetical protein
MKTLRKIYLIATIVSAVVSLMRHQRADKRLPAPRRTRAAR